MIKQWTWRTTLSPDDVFRRPSEWSLITAAEAKIQSQWAPVVVVSRAPTGDQAAWYDEHATFFRGAGPPTARTLRYYQYLGGVPGVAAVHAATEVEEPKPPPEPEAEPPERITLDEHWIEIRLIDMNDQPIANEEYRLELPDGSLVEKHKTDADGRARIDSIDPGNCKISFPNLDSRDWQRVATK